MSKANDSRNKSACVKPSNLPSIGDQDLSLAFKFRNDIGNSERLRQRYGHKFRSIRHHRWHVWDKCRWNSRDGDHEIAIAAQLTSDAIRKEAEAMEAYGSLKGESDKDFKDRIDTHYKWAVSSGNSNRLMSMVREAQPHLEENIDAMDANPWLFNTKNGTLCLAPPNSKADIPPVEKLIHDPHDLITRVCNAEYDPEAGAPNFLNFINKILPNPEIMTFVQRYLGYCLTGDTSEQALILLHGSGANGKSTLVDLISWVLGDYAVVLPFSSLLQDDRRRGGDATPDIARLPGVRLVRASEPDSSSKFSESTIKMLTGERTITARHLNNKFFEFEPEFKLVLSFNNKPYIQGQDEGIWRRLLLVPFDVQIPPSERIGGLDRQLRKEASGILNWLIDGFLMWRERGLDPPEAIRSATAQYRSESDRIGLFVDGCIVKAEGVLTRASDIYDAYKNWCKENAVDPISHNAFSRKMAEKSFERIRPGGTTHYLNIGLTEAARAYLEANHGYRRGENDDYAN